MDILQESAQSLIQIKCKKPLIHHLTNYVTVNDCANITLAIGASPVMANDLAEVEEMAACASALVLNMGALNPGMAASMLAAGKKAAQLRIPVVFDPVGVGATRFRMNTAERIIADVCPTVIKGNMAEIKALSGQHQGTKGVDSTADETDAEAVAVQLSQKFGCVVVVTGKIDMIAHGSTVCKIYNGHPMLSSVTGTGCMATSLAASCCGAVDNYFVGAIAGIAVMGIAGELAGQQLKPGEGLGTFRMRIFDAVSNMNADSFLKYAKLTISKGE